jgi:predicted MFS family arabinose efflux permease
VSAGDLSRSRDRPRSPQTATWFPRLPDVIMLLWSIGSAALLPFVSLRAKGLGMAPSMIGLLLSAPGLASLLSSLVADRALAASGPRRLMLLGAVAAAVTIFAAGTTHSVPLFAALLLVYWGVFPLVAIACQTLVITTAAAPDRDHAVGMHSFYTSMGYPIGPLLAATAVHTWGTEAAAFPVSAITLLGAALAALAAPKGRGPATTRTSLVAGLRASGPGVRTALWAALVAQFCYDGWHAFYPLALAAVGRSPTAIGVIFGAFGAAVPVVRPLLGRVSARIGRTGVLVLAFCCIAVGGWAATVPASSAAVLACVILLGVGFGLSFPVTMLLVTEGVEAAAISRMLSARFLVMMSGGTLGPVTVGVIAARSLPAAMAALAVAGTAAFLALARSRFKGHVP